MKLLQTLISTAGFRQPNRNQDRLAALADLLGIAANEEVRLVILPAGYLSTTEEDEIPAVINSVRGLAEQ